jgi:hypothetical protein
MSKSTTSSTGRKPVHVEPAPEPVAADTAPDDQEEEGIDLREIGAALKAADQDQGS